MKVLRHKVTGQTFPYSALFAEHPNLEVLEDDAPEVEAPAPKKPKSKKAPPPAAPEGADIDELLSGIEDE